MLKFPPLPRVIPWMMKVEPFKNCLVNAHTDVAIKAVVVEPDERFKGDLILRGYVNPQIHWQAPIQHAMQAWKRLSQLKLGPLTNDVVKNGDLLKQWSRAVELATMPFALATFPLLIARGQYATLYYNAPDGSVNISSEGPNIFVTLYGLQMENT